MIKKKIMGKITNCMCFSFIQQSILTWIRQEFGNNNGIDLIENSITDFNLLELQIKHPYEIKTQTYSNTKEGETGADWEWWLGFNHNWLGFRIQAKKLDSRKLEYNELDHSNLRGRQIDILIKEALNEDIPRIPSYVFYNYWNTVKISPEWKCNINPDCFEFLSNEKLFGCGFSHADLVKKTLDTKGKKLDDILTVTYPWSCLICCPELSKDSKDLPNRAFDFIKGISKDDFQCENYNKRHFITQKIPNYIQKIIDGEILHEDDWKQARVNKITVISENYKIRHSFSKFQEKK